MEVATAYPLSWPTWVKRTPTAQRGRAKFASSREKFRTHGDGSSHSYRESDRVSVAVARERLQREVDRLGGRDAILSTNLELRLDGQPRSDRREPDDVGAALYFTLNEKPICLPCDRWDRVADNIVGIAKHIEALRGQERWGVGTVEQAFSGYVALPPQNHVDWRATLQLHRADTITAAMIAEAYKRLAFERHPDHGGSDAMMAELNAAREQALKEIAP